jgi:membrane-bound metal-dependent hydrolase YbcI (DUF457 family)
MVDVMGHIAMAMLWAIPAWFIWSRKVALTFVGFAAVAGLLPDMDLYLSQLFPAAVHHHGVTHTVVFVVILGLVLGGLVAVTLTGPIDRWLDSERFDKKSLFGFTSAALIVGGLAHLFADSLSAPDIASPIEPFWPFFNKPWSVDLIWYNSIWWNLGLLVLAVVLHATLAYTSKPRDHSYRIASR